MVERTPWAVPVWRIDLDGLAADVPELIADIQRRAGEYTVPDVPGRQTRDDLQDSDRIEWQRFHAELLGATDRIVAATSRDLTDGRRFCRSRGVLFESVADFRPGRWWVHTHQPATFSTVVTLQTPTGVGSAEEGGTVLRNPWASLARASAGTSTWESGAVVPGGIIFPGPIEHWPRIPAELVDFDVPRVLVVTDVVYW
ncbi:hypothetical protein [Dermatobacter hominis]|uniref:hypothetical protein n=1 Tax=Dermatobacter hominis TaxID=2884263 RepID=UPI001D11346A|nr:hypothetical protein [Dermatobacter hominis]UDY33944.1 hypothetical protein LH044_11360 [Dermatobacter hominis]